MTMTREERLKFCSICKNRQMDINQGIICSISQASATFENECPHYIADEVAITKEAEKQKALEDSKRISGWLAFFLWVGLGGGGLVSLIYGISYVVDEGMGIFFSILYFATIISLFVTAIYAIWAFYNKRTNAVSAAKTYIVMIVLDGIIGLLLGRILKDGEWVPYIRQFVWAAIWYSFLMKSEDVDFIIPKESRTKGKVEKTTLSVYIGAIVLLLLSIVYMRESYNPDSMFFSKNTYITQSIEESNKELPMEINDGLTLQRVNMDEKVITYTFQLTSTYRYELDETYLEGNAKVNKYEMLHEFSIDPKSDEFVATCLENGYTVVYKYIDAIAEDLYQVEISPNEYSDAIKNPSYKCPSDVLSSYIYDYNVLLPVEYMGDGRLEKISMLNDSTILYEVTLPELTVDELKDIDSEYLNNYIKDEWDNLTDFVIRLAVVNQMTVGFQFKTYSGLKYLRVDITPAIYNQL